MQAPSINCSVSALRFFFTVTLDRPDLSRRFVLVRHPCKLPTMLSVEAVGRLLEAAPGSKYKAMLGTAYGAGLRYRTSPRSRSATSTARTLIRVEQGKRGPYSTPLHKHIGQKQTKQRQRQALAEVSGFGSRR